MRLRLRRRRVGRAAEISRTDLLDGIRAITRGMHVEHHHIVEQKPVPKPESAEVIFIRPDGSESYRYVINCGRQALTTLTVPLTAIYPAAPSEYATLQFRWHR